MDKKYWTMERLNRLYKDWDPKVLADLKAKIAKSNWRLGYHIQTKTGLLNDPNGFSYFNNQWHLFFQAFPYGGVHGLKSWTHMVSSDLVNWKNINKPMVPDRYYDRHGCYSGSAINVDDKLFLMYTGNVFEDDDEYRRHPYQNGAWMDKDNNIEKLPNPLIDDAPSGITGHFRDPQILKHGDYYYAILGAQNIDNEGEILTYRSKHVDKDWEFYKVMDLGHDNLGYMAECPNLGFVDGKVVLIFCPQGADDTKFSYDNVHPNAYIIADDFDWENMKLINPSSMHLVDEGFDFYATQLFNAPDGRLLESAWIGLPDTEYLSDNEGWEGALTMVRELHIKDDRLIQTPVKENNSLIGAEDIIKNNMQLDKQSLIKFNVEDGKDSEMLIASDDSYLKLSFDKDSHKFKLTRKNIGEDEDSRSVLLGSSRLQDCAIYFDNTVFEIYINDGQRTMTGTFFHDGKHLNLKFNNLDNVSVNKLSNIGINA
ncbi:sucrose-6-phosphate hydrolase [Apilactobacillus timberlakei]|uniref:Sucrose-6-phosphate hydrolase n=1 Tax=Apilactobacillus timberlakei TaxID=2008380 RepID=A0ABY2YXR9_9LACO|nr:sucrose-6-phosphate hydrolase [Apilactobacillus timberlakei]TPR13151.1 sucrose-6-phosphate hydrolase [Apilactobacillus timberlakei]TPR14201.1 sucrose-6-phosphate hydrolase [Apilactobacillus timberlakei]TPR16454.1 sucrose-6-phosphate hydrolase [Apilactobacillus timberlakei]